MNLVPNRWCRYGGWWWWWWW